ncbi:pectinesterase family protein [Saccharicrinis fermentans]|uniref:Pectate lyase L n=1 Tax=Saccharicrinis fermentans DSM 9555 = JCM 21142 TaxID=869213 RepID=W7XYQ6_9BACT|nr:pectinesterase family protein [Saccharicrinis fermentans]GAF03765.1 pectate lyase L precursor [Saccharicrinis fermentans DSM 9555 = JCM 21142]
MRKFSIFIFLMVVCVYSYAAVYYVSTSGSDEYSGVSVSSPLASIPKAVSVAQAGDIIFIRGGVYAYSAKISISRNGTSENPIRLENYQNEKVVIDFSPMSLNSSNRGFSLSADYWRIKGLKIMKAGDNGMHISGHYNVIENCVFFANRDTGLQLGNGASNNKIVNCDSYGNADPEDFGDADGFACKIDVGDYNYFYGCRAWLNVDDGWDGYMKDNTQAHTQLENCWTWMNGYFLDGSDGGESANGNGFKVGGSSNKDLEHHFTLVNCVAFDNKSKGFDQNNNTGNMKFYNCTAFRNKVSNYSIPRALNNGNVAEVKNCIAIDDNVKVGNFVEQQNNSWNGVSFDQNDFLSVDTTGVSGPREADGSLPELDLFKLAEGSSLIDAGLDLGYEYDDLAPDMGAFESNFNGLGILPLKNNMWVFSYSAKRCFVLTIFILNSIGFNCFGRSIDFVVAKDGTGDFLTVQEAINAVPDFRKITTTIWVKNGVYKEKLVLPASKTRLTLLGESARTTIITFDDFAAKKNRFGEEMGTTGSSGFFVFGDEFTARNITFENSSGPVGQAVAVRVDGDKACFYNCRFLGFQDTLYPHRKESRQYYENCYIEGTVDFIFGWATAVFYKCEIFCKDKGYVTAAATPEGKPYGFVFLNCKVTGNAPDKSVYLGRPWRPYAKTVFIECELGDVIRDEGWHNWNKSEAEKNAFYAEYNNSGRGAVPQKRMSWSKQLSKKQREEYTLINIFNGWTPACEHDLLDDETCHENGFIHRGVIKLGVFHMPIER